MKTAFEIATFEHMDKLYATAMRLTRNPKDAEDLVQDTYLKAFRFFDRFEPGTNCKAWMLTILTNTFINRYRRKVRERDFIEMKGREIEARPDTRDFIDDLMSDEVMAALERLAVDYRTVVLLADVQGLSYREIASAIDRPIGTVMSRLHRGRRMLRKELHDHAVQVGIVREQRAA